MFLPPHVRCVTPPCGGRADKPTDPRVCIVRVASPTESSKPATPDKHRAASFLLLFLSCIRRYKADLDRLVRQGYRVPPARFMGEGDRNKREVTSPVRVARRPPARLYSCKACLA